MPNASDALLAKTDAELRFFVEHPQYYQPELVSAARRELQRRGANLAAPPAGASEAPDPATAYSPVAAAGPRTTTAAEAVAAPAASSAPPAAWQTEDLREPARRPWLVPILVLLAVGAGLVLYRWAAANQQAAQVAAARTAARLSPDSLKLDAVATVAIPTYNIAQIVDKQVATVPAKEKLEAQPLRQFREMSRRFWAAETEAEYLTKLAHDGQAGPAFANQAQLNRENWRAWNKGAMYGFKFGPTMRTQYELMGKVASSQQHVMTRLPNLLPNQAFLADKELRARDADVQAWMAGLRRVSPVTGQPYRIATLEASQLAH